MFLKDIKDWLKIAMDIVYTYIDLFVTMGMMKIFPPVRFKLTRFMTGHFSTMEYIRCIT